jgi:hypothetical protein
MNNEDDARIECGHLFASGGDADDLCVLCGEPLPAHDVDEGAGLQGRAEIIVEGSGVLTVERTLT